ncbi:capZ-interacting protein isoform X2 [Engraulis encrasicolus]|uniref:capZ-interacting protein isoform X2 n=1 Tax=Engraulis encrasicolus TaxID=184585 RepID=UPI002FD132DA
MEEDCTVKTSVAELAGRFKGHPLPMPMPNDERPIRRRPPSSLNFQNKKDGESEPERPAIVSPLAAKGKLKNSPLFEKIQANLALSPTALSPEVKLQAPFPVVPPVGSSPSPCSPLSPTSLRPTPTPTHTQTNEEEVPVSFEQPAEGTPLPSINKCRARLSFKRRPPTRQHRKSASEGPDFSPTDEPNGDAADVFDAPTEGRTSPQPSVVKETSEEHAEEEEKKEAEKDMKGKEEEKKSAWEESKAQETQGAGGAEENQQEEKPGAALTIENSSTPEGGDSSAKN